MTFKAIALATILTGLGTTSALAQGSGIPEAEVEAPTPQSLKLSGLKWKPRRASNWPAKAFRKHDNTSAARPVSTKRGRPFNSPAKRTTGPRPPEP